MAEWDVAKMSGRCAVSGRELAEGEEFYAVLFERDEGFERVDYSLDCWQGPPENAFCYWKSRVPAREKKKRLFVDDETLINFFLRLADEEEALKVNFRFVLALILMRKRLLKYEETIRDDGNEYWQMRLVGEQSVHRVLNPQLDDEKIRSVSAELGAILHADSGAFEQEAG